MTYINKQAEKNLQYQDKKKSKAKYLNDQSSAKSFIRNQASIDDLVELEQLIAERKNVLPQ